MVDVCPDRTAPVVVAGVGLAAFPVALAALGAGHQVVRLLTGPHELPDDADDRAAQLAAAAPAERLTITAEPSAAAGFAVAVLTEAPDPDPAIDGVSPVEYYAAALAPLVGRGSVLVVSSPTAQHAGVVVDATLELLTGLRAGRDYALAHLFPPTANGRVVVSGVDEPSLERARGWLTTLAMPAVPIMPVATAEVVATLLAQADSPPTPDLSDSQR